MGTAKKVVRADAGGQVFGLQLDRASRATDAAQTYNHISGTNDARLAALSDGVFGFAMTLLVLDLQAPAAAAISSDRGLLAALGAQGPQLLIYIMTFLELGILWIAQQAQLNHIERSDRRLTWMHLAFLFVVTLMPFSTKLMAQFIHYRSALLIYWLSILLLGGLRLGSWRYACRQGLTAALTPVIKTEVTRHILVTQALYAVCALLGLVDTFLSISGIILVQINLAVGSNLSGLKRLLGPTQREVPWLTPSGESPLWPAPGFVDSILS